MKTKPFDLAQALSGKPVVYGLRPVTEIKLFNTTLTDYPVVAFVAGAIRQFSRGGIEQVDDSSYFPGQNLLMLVETGFKWYNVYSRNASSWHAKGVYHYLDGPYDSGEAAEIHRLNSTGTNCKPRNFLKVIFLEYEV